MASHSKQKGKRGEREVVALAKEFGLKAVRTWQTAQSLDATTRACDVTIGSHAFQVKLKQAGFQQLYDALRGVSGAFVRQDNQPWLVVMPAETFLRMFEYFHREES